MRHEVLPLVAPSSVTTGTPIRVDRYVQKTVQLTGTFVATLDLEGSLDGTNYAPLIAGISTPGLFTITAAVMWVRWSTKAYTSGTPASQFAGFDSRTDGG